MPDTGCADRTLKLPRCLCRYSKSKDENNVLNSLSETIDDGCAPPPTPPMVTRNNDISRAHHNPSSRSIPGNDPSEFEGELLFTPYPQNVASALGTP